MLKNISSNKLCYQADQIIPINGMLKNGQVLKENGKPDQIIPINGMLKNCAFSTTVAI